MDARTREYEQSEYHQGPRGTQLYRALANVAHGALLEPMPSREDVPQTAPIEVAGMTFTIEDTQGLQAYGASGGALGAQAEL